MNRLIYLLFTLTLSLSASAQFCFLPQQPQVGQTVSFTYSPQTTPLATDSTLEARCLRYGAPDKMRAISRPYTTTLVRQGNDYVGEVYISTEDIRGAMLYFRNSSQPKRTDVNKGQFYVIPVFDGPNKLTSHASAGQASVFTRTQFASEAGIRADPAWTVTLYEHELARHSDLRPHYWYDLIAAQIKQRKPGYGPKAKADIESYLSTRPTPTPVELADAARLYESMGDMANVTALRERRKQAEPDGAMMQKDLALAVRTEPNWTRQRALYEAFRKDFPKSTHLPALTILLTDGYYKNNDIPGMVTFVTQQPDAYIDPMMLSSIVFLMADDRRALPEAEQLIKRGLVVLNTQPKPGDVGNWDAEKQNRRRQLMNTYTRVLEQQNKYAEAYTAYQDVINPDDVENSDPRTTERYFMAALRTNHAAQARPFMEAAVQEGRATKATKAALRDWYAKQPGNTPAKASAYLADLEADLKADQRDELRHKLINEPAPAFALTDLQGRTISSSAFKGKVIVLDFWATWCGPCIASFPAMKRAKDQFQDDPNVRFLFVSTREGGPLQRVHNFMAKNPSYDFVVPLDSQQKVANAYKVQGIPTKVVIGPNGRVRYRAIGYTGNPDATVDELTMVVEMLKAEP